MCGSVFPLVLFGCRCSDCIWRWATCGSCLAFDPPDPPLAVAAKRETENKGHSSLAKTRQSRKLSSPSPPCGQKILILPAPGCESWNSTRRMLPNGNRNEKNWDFLLSSSNARRSPTSQWQGPHQRSAQSKGPPGAAILVSHHRWGLEPGRGGLVLPQGWWWLLVARRPTGPEEQKPVILGVMFRSPLRGETLSALVKCMYVCGCLLPLPLSAHNALLGLQWAIMLLCLARLPFH